MALKQLAVVVGAGPGLGRALALRFAQGGFDISLLARNAAHLQPIADEIHAGGRKALMLAVDATDAAAMHAAFEKLRSEAGEPSVLLYNAGQIEIGGLLELDPARFEQAWKIQCFGAFLASREVLPAMRDAGRGTLLFTGATAALRGGARFAGFAVGKFGLRALVQSIAREFGPAGIHAAHVVIDGQIATPRNRARMPDRAPDSLLDPAAIAETYWQLHTQPRSAWTQELDLRPASEKF